MYFSRQFDRRWTDIVPSNNVLLVLIVREAGLRSTLAARLSLVGADLISAESLDDPALKRGVRKPGYLIVEEELFEGRDGIWLETLLATPHWRQVVMLTAGGPVARAPDEDPRLLRLERRSAPSAIAELVPRWAADRSDY